MASPLPSVVGTFMICRLRMMTLLTLVRLRPQPVRPAEAPTPMMDLLEVTLISVEQVKCPLTRIVCGEGEPAALTRAATVVTVTVGPEPPPVVPPAMVDQPS